MSGLTAPVPGLVSVTYRQLPADEVVRLAVAAGLSAIEWGGDVHVPAGKFAEAERVGQLCADAGLDICSYGSYYYAGHDDLEVADKVVRTAISLGAPNIRVWAGRAGSAECSTEQRHRVAEDIGGLAALAAEHGLQVAVECHPETLTDTLPSTLQLLDDIKMSAGVVRPYWQPVPGQRVGEAGKHVDALLPLLRTVHVFAWSADGGRLPLRSAAPLWQDVLGRLARATEDDGTVRYALLEFVPGDAPEALGVEAATLCDWLTEVS